MWHSSEKLTGTAGERKEYRSEARRLQGRRDLIIKHPEWAPLAPGAKVLKEGGGGEPLAPFTKLPDPRLSQGTQSGEGKLRPGIIPGAGPHPGLFPGSRGVRFSEKSARRFIGQLLQE